MIFQNSVKQNLKKCQKKINTIFYKQELFQLEQSDLVEIYNNAQKLNIVDIKTWVDFVTERNKFIVQKLLVGGIKGDKEDDYTEFQLAQAADDIIESIGEFIPIDGSMVAAYYKIDNDERLNKTVNEAWRKFAKWRLYYIDETATVTFNSFTSSRMMKKIRFKRRKSLTIAESTIFPTKIVGEPLALKLQHESVELGSNNSDEHCGDDGTAEHKYSKPYLETDCANDRDNISPSKNILDNGIDAESNEVWSPCESDTDTDFKPPTNNLDSNENKFTTINDNPSISTLNSKMTESDTRLYDYISRIDDSLERLRIIKPFKFDKEVSTLPYRYIHRIPKDLEDDEDLIKLVNCVAPYVLIVPSTQVDMIKVKYTGCTEQNQKAIGNRIQEVLAPHGLATHDTSTEEFDIEVYEQIESRRFPILWT